MEGNSQDKNSLVELVDSARCSKGWTRTKLAYESDVAQPVVSRFLNNAKNIAVENIYRILSALDLLNYHQTSNFQPPALKIQITKNLRAKHRSPELDNYIPVRLLKDAAAAGSPSEIRETDQDGWCLIYADKKWMPHDPEQYTCCRIRGSSMEPILQEGDIIAIDHSLKDPDTLDRQMVAFRVDGGITVKWLNKLRDDLVVGIPSNQHSEELESVVYLEKDQINTGIIGKIAWWWAKR